MKISVHESETLVAIVKSLLFDMDPDFPIDKDSGIPQSVNDRLEVLLSHATDDVTNCIDLAYEDFELVQLIRCDAILLEIASLPWVHAKVEDLEGTIVLIFGAVYDCVA
jgi:hypothetical protein